MLSGVVSPLSEGSSGDAHAPRIQLLRSFALVRDDCPIALPDGAQRLLALLALRQGCLPRQAVADILWLGAPPQRRGGDLRSALWRLNRVDRRLIRSNGELIGLSADVRVDVCEVAEQARRLLDGGAAPALRLEHLLVDLLPRWPDDWVVVERERFRQLRLHALEVLCSRLSRLGKHEEAIEAGLAGVNAEPLRGTARRVLISAYVRAGRHLDARREYQEYLDLSGRRRLHAPSAALGEERSQPTVGKLEAGAYRGLPIPRRSR